MLQLKTPGVYRQDIFPIPPPQLLTGVPGFLGLTQAKNAQGKDIPVNEPRKLTLWTEFEQYFGKSLNNSYLAYAVRGFFENGGRQCYVVLLRENTPKALEEGLACLASLDTIDLICAPDIMQLKQKPESVIQMQQVVLEHCDQMGDRFAILDALSTLDALLSPEQIKEQIKEQRQRLQDNNGALYAPWLKVENISEPIPPCGHIAGIYAKCDREVGVHRAPANYALEGVLDLSSDLSNANDSDPGVNYLQAFIGRGIRIWGAYTLSKDPNWRYINVRRLFITVGRWIEMNLADVVFEPNNFQLWLRIERELTAYCESLWQQGALKGNSPQDAFFVKCNAETNPPDLREVGQVVTELGLAPTVPNEFIVIRLIHGNSGVTLTTPTQA